ncbi:MAG: AraC family ligand binding domain-containing protein [Azoarcus sp.]|jgi:quercetin dioxygenase-like cupin family protein|nr:AraC family ligand binding domain-containing protein [Azoarcus sp.]
MPPLAVLTAIDALRAHFAARLAASREPSAIAAELQNILSLLDTVDLGHADEKYLRPSAHPVIRQLQQTPPRNSEDSTAAIFRAFLPQLDALPWRYSYAPRPDAPDIGERMAWAELIGPIAPFKSAKVCLGLTAIGPRLLYPRHRHPAVETYLVVSGTAAWTAENTTRRHPPGTLILHPANIVHAMETGGEPLLAAYAWTGDVETLSAYEDVCFNPRP